MNNLISRSALLQEFETETNKRRGNDLCHYTGIKAMIENTPTVEAVPVVYGEWMEFDIDYGGIPTVGYQCSECGQSNGFITDFCPNCGADMRKKVE